MKDDFEKLEQVLKLSRELINLLEEHPLFFDDYVKYRGNIDTLDLELKGVLSLQERLIFKLKQYYQKETLKELVQGTTSSTKPTKRLGKLLSSQEVCNLFDFPINFRNTITKNAKEGNIKHVVTGKRKSYKVYFWPVVAWIRANKHYSNENKFEAYVKEHEADWG